MSALDEVADLCRSRPSFRHTHDNAFRAVECGDCGAGLSGPADPESDPDGAFAAMVAAFPDSHDCDEDRIADPERAHAEALSVPAAADTPIFAALVAGRADWPTVDADQMPPCVRGCEHPAEALPENVVAYGGHGCVVHLGDIEARDHNGLEPLIPVQVKLTRFVFDTGQVEAPRVELCVNNRLDPFVGSLPLEALPKLTRLFERAAELAGGAR